MKKLLIIALVIFNSSIVATESLERKSLYVGPADNRGEFSTCVAEEAVKQLLEDGTEINTLLHSGVNINDSRPWIEANLYFIINNEEGKRSFVSVALESLDQINGWDLIRHSSGEIAPYTDLLNVRAQLRESDRSPLGEFSLEACRNL